jgi:hypothetical protein
MRVSTFRFALIAWCTACLVFAQTNVSRIVGIVSDPSGAVIPAATITVRNENTGETRTLQSNEHGLYVAAQLAPAAYSIKVEAPGMAPSEYSGIRVQVGSERTLSVILQPSTMTTEVNVSAGDLTVIDVSSASVGANVGEREVASLPLNGRQLSQLYLLAPGATTAGGGAYDNIRFNGRSNQQNIVRFDGVSGGGIIDQSPGDLNGELTSNFRLQSSLENVQEFRVESSNYPAEYGTGTGGQVSVVTKSGSNQVHGGLFEYVRNDHFDARNFFDLFDSKTKSQLRMNQFGGSIGGPIKKDKLFFFLSQETFYQRAGVSLRETVPSAAARAQAQINAATNPKVAAILPLLNAYPVGQVATANALLDAAFLGAASRVDEYYGSLRLDYHANDKNSFSFRYFRDQGDSLDPLSVTGRAQNFTLVPQNAMASWSRTLSSTSMNEFKLGLNAAKSRSFGVVNNAAGVDLAPLTVSFTGAVAIPGVGGQGASAGAAQLGGLVRANSAYNTRAQPYTNWELPIMDTLSMVRGKHSLKFGAEIRPIRIKTDRFAGATYTYADITNLLANTPASVQFNADFGLPSPWNGGLTGPRHAQQQYYIFYAQDEFKAAPEITVNYGLRYEYFGVMHERDNRNVKFNTVTGQIDPSDTPYYESSQLNFGPRLGIAYSPSRFRGNTVFRIGGGYFFGPGQPEDTIQPLESDRVSRTLTPSLLPGLAYPLDTASVIANYNINDPNLGFQPRAYAPGYKLPERVMSYTASVQQKLPGDAVLTVAYVGSLGRNLFLRSYSNKIVSVATNPTTGAAIINREFGNRFAEVDVKTSGGNDHYNSLQTILNRRFSKGLTFGLQHTWGRSIGESAGSNEAVSANDPYNFKSEYGPNNFDIHHSLNLTALWEIPVGKDKAVRVSGPANYIAGGWELGGIYNYRTGLPINVILTRDDVVYRDKRNGRTYRSPVIVDNVVQTEALVNSPGGLSSRQFRRPDAVAGVTPLVVGADKTVYLNPAAFSIPAPGTFGNLSRNAVIGPDLSQFDLTLHKRIPVNEKVNFEFRAEVYNLFNRANFANPPATLGVGLPSGYTTTSAAEPAASGLQPGAPFTASAAGGAFGKFSSTVTNTVGLGAQRQIQLSLRLNF